MKLLLTILLTLLTTIHQAFADSILVHYQNKCADIVVGSEDWRCLNETQAAQHGETLQQVTIAVKNTRYKQALVVYSIDPIRFGDEYRFGAWKKNGKIYFAAMPGCPNARRDLEKLLKPRKKK